jgi:hypothetical protein
LIFSPSCAIKLKTFNLVLSKTFVLQKHEFYRLSGRFGRSCSQGNLWGNWGGGVVAFKYFYPCVKKFFKKHCGKKDENDNQRTDLGSHSSQTPSGGVSRVVAGDGVA